MGNPFPTLNGGGLDRKYNTIADEFKARDYSTHFVGKWGIDYPDPHPRDPNRTELVVVTIFSLNSCFLSCFIVLFDGIIIQYLILNQYIFTSINVYFTFFFFATADDQWGWGQEWAWSW